MQLFVVLSVCSAFLEVRQRFSKSIKSSVGSGSSIVELLMVVSGKSRAGQVFVLS